jgi:heptaprenyl diphosphate synthase
MTPSVSDASSDHLIAGFAALAVVIQVLEASFPSPIPGIKPGLANAVTLIVLLRHGWRSAAWVSALRVLAGSLLTGSFLAPAFWLSASGALCSLLILGLCAQWNRLSPVLALSTIGLSVLSALAHMSGQFFVAYHWFVPHPGVFKLLPVLMSAALLFGIVTGAATQQILRRLKPTASKPILPP